MKINVDLRLALFAVRDQGTRPTCLACAASDLHAGHHGNPELLSAEFLFYHAVQNMTPSDPFAGISMPALKGALMKNGQPLEVEWPYLEELPQPRSDWTPPEIVGSLWYGNLNIVDLGIDELTELVEAGHRVLLAIKLSQCFFNPDGFEVVCVTDGDQVTPHTHAVLVVAIGEHSKFGKCLLLRNSWGGNWGLDGHIWATMEYIDNCLIEAGRFIGDDDEAD